MFQQSRSGEQQRYLGLHIAQIVHVDQLAEVSERKPKLHEIPSVRVSRRQVISESYWMMSSGTSPVRRSDVRLAAMRFLKRRGFAGLSKQHEICSEDVSRWNVSFGQNETDETALLFVAVPQIYGKVSGKIGFVAQARVRTPCGEPD